MIVEITYLLARIEEAVSNGSRHRETQPGHYPTFGEFQRFFVSHVAAAVVARVYAHFNELRRRARAFVLHEAR